MPSAENHMSPSTSGHTLLGGHTTGSHVAVAVFNLNYIGSEHRMMPLDNLETTSNKPKPSLN